MTVTLETALSGGHAAGLDHVRLAAALAVVVSHAWPLALGPGAAEPLSGLIGVSLGHSAVLVFFALSGVLIARSAEARKPAAFWRARARRVLPGLAFALCVTVALAVASGATPSAPEVAIYIARGITLVSLEHQITGAFAQNPYAGAVNGPLWTLFYEIACYAALALLVTLGALRRAASWVILLATLGGALWAIHAGMIPAEGVGLRVIKGVPLSLAFFCGAAAWRFRTHVILNARLACAALALATVTAWLWPNSAVADAALAIGLGYAALCLGLRPGAKKLNADLSYGVYLLGWPVAQSVIALCGPMSPVLLAGLSVVAVLPLAWISWHWVEAPALRKPAAPLTPAGA